MTYNRKEGIKRKMKARGTLGKCAEDWLKSAVYLHELNIKLRRRT